MAQQKMLKKAITVILHELLSNDDLPWEKHKQLTEFLNSSSPVHLQNFLDGISYWLQQPDAIKDMCALRVLRSDQSNTKHRQRHPDSRVDAMRRLESYMNEQGFDTIKEAYFNCIKDYLDSQPLLTEFAAKTYGDKFTRLLKHLGLTNGVDGEIQWPDPFDPPKDGLQKKTSDELHNALNLQEHPQNAVSIAQVSKFYAAVNPHPETPLGTQAEYLNGTYYYVRRSATGCRQIDVWLMRILARAGSSEIELQADGIDEQGRTISTIGGFLVPTSAQTWRGIVLGYKSDARDHEHLVALTEALEFRANKRTHNRVHHGLSTRTVTLNQTPAITRVLLVKADLGITRRFSKPAKPFLFELSDDNEGCQKEVRESHQEYLRFEESLSQTGGISVREQLEKYLFPDDEHGVLTIYEE